MNEDPLERDPQRVLEDVKEGWVSAESARSDYGMVVRGSGAGGVGTPNRGVALPRGNPHFSQHDERVATLAK